MAAVASAKGGPGSPWTVTDDIDRLEDTEDAESVQGPNETNPLLAGTSVNTLNTFNAVAVRCAEAPLRPPPLSADGRRSSSRPAILIPPRPTHAPPPPRLPYAFQHRPDHPGAHLASPRPTTRSGSMSTERSRARMHQRAPTA